MYHWTEIGRFSLFFAKRNSHKQWETFDIVSQFTEKTLSGNKCYNYWKPIGTTSFKEKHSDLITSIFVTQENEVKEQIPFSHDNIFLKFILTLRPLFISCSHDQAVHFHIN